MTDISTGETLFAEGKVKEAEKCFLDLLKKEPSNAEALNDLGVIQYAKENVEEAEDLFLKAIAAKQEYLDAHLNLISLYQDAKRWREAVAQLEECIQIENKDSNLFNMLGTFCLEMGNTEKARMALIKSLELNPDQELVRDSLKELEKKDAGPEIKVQEKPLNILFVQEAPCIRNYKMATALRARGHRVSLAYTKALLSQMYKGLSDDVYDENIHISDFRQLWDLSRNYDIVHCHNEPDILTVAALAGDAPVIHDTHDLISLRANGDPNLSYFEGVANRGATGRVYTTPYQMEEAQKLYGVNGPSLVFYNYVSQSDLPKSLLPKCSTQDGKIHIVYEGGIGGNGHRDFLSLFIELAKLGNYIHIYPTFYDAEIARYFSEFPNIHYNNPLSPKEIIEAMSQFDFGIIPFNLEKGNKRFLDSTIANKLFEYLAAGLPVLASPLRSYVDYFSKNPVGITFQDGKDIIESIPRLKKIAETTDFSELIFTYEGEIERLVEFYRAVANNGSRKVRVATDEATRAREHWQDRGVIGCYFEEGPQSIGIVKAVEQLRKHEDIESVLEFGCNVGRNLNCLRRDVGGLRLLGIDINRDAINVGREHYKLPLVHGGEEKLNEIQDGAYDVVFTVSVLDHIPHVEAVLRELLRIAKRYFIAIEPFSESKEDASKYAVADYSYFWDYPHLFAKLGGVLVHDEPCPLSNRGLGPFYRLFVAKPGQQQDQTESKPEVEKSWIGEICAQYTQTGGSYTDWLKAMVAKKCNSLTAEEVIDGGKIRLDRPNVVIRHDVDFSPQIGLRMAQAEGKLGVKSTFYVFTPDKYKTIFPEEAFQALEREGWEVGYHTSTENLKEALSDIEKLRQFFNIRTTVPHMGNLSICKGELQNHIKVLRDGQRFLVQDDGYIADNGGRLQMRISVLDDGTNRWKSVSNEDILHFIGEMKPGKVYHFLFHPCWYDQELNFIGRRVISEKPLVPPLARPIQSPSKGKVEIEKCSAIKNCHRGKAVPKNLAIFIGGTGRSGTTILREIMGAHSEIAAIPYETKLIGQQVFRDFPAMIRRCPPHEKRRLLEDFKRLWLNEFYRFKAGWNVKPGDDQWRGLHKWLKKEDVKKCMPLLDAVAESPNEYETYIAYGRFINALFSKFAKREGKKHWVEKTTPNSVYAPFWYRCFPNLKLVNIIRDGRDVACSMGKVTWGIKDPKKALDWWAENIINGLEAQKYLPEHAYLNITYEDLVLEKKNTLEQITDFLGVDWDDALCSVEVFEQSVGRWQKELPDEAKAYAEAQYRHLLKTLGYQTNGHKAHPSMIVLSGRKEKDAAFYDETYRNGGWQQEYHKHYRARSHFPVWKIALTWLQELGAPRILEVGCGSGQFAKMLFDNGLREYRGFDFSPVAIRLAKNMNPQFKDAFSVDNAYTSSIYDSDFNVAVIFEVLEHIENDLTLLERVKPGTIILFSVPNFDSASHVRWFETQTAIRRRYDKLIEIKDIREIGFASTTNKIYLVRGKRIGDGNN